MIASYMKKHVAITQEHGSWVFLLSPLLMGFFAAGRWQPASGILILAALGAFLFKQPLTIAVKILSKRRPREELPAAIFWMCIYGCLVLAGLGGLIRSGYGYLAGLAVPAMLVLGWYLYLVARREERRQIGVEIVASGTLALGATAAYWVGVGNADPLGWWLWLLAWLQSAASIVYAALRLEQRTWKACPGVGERIKVGARALAYTTFNVSLSVALGVLGVLSAYLWTAYAIQWVETIYGVLRPAIGVKPTRIGFRQLFVSTLFTIVFILAWRQS